MLLYCTVAHSFVLFPNCFRPPRAPRCTACDHVGTLLPVGSQGGILHRLTFIVSCLRCFEVTELFMFISFSEEPFFTFKTGRRADALSWLSCHAKKVHYETKWHLKKAQTGHYDQLYPSFNQRAIWRGEHSWWVDGHVRCVFGYNCQWKWSSLWVKLTLKSKQLWSQCRMPCLIFPPLEIETWLDGVFFCSYTF